MGVVQSVESFSKGKFCYTGYNAHGDIWYYLPSDPPEGIPPDPRYVKPPLLDTFSCPGDVIQHAWYSERGRAQGVRAFGLSAKSYAFLSDWRAEIGYSDVNRYRGRGASEHNATLKKPETGYGPYNDYIRDQWQQR